MYNFLTDKPIIAAAFIVAVIVAAIIVLIKVMQTLGLEKIRERTYQLFVTAEAEFQYGDNEAKFEYVINFAKSAIPLPFSLFITESLLRKVVQLWFDLCKDLLDDGKLNKSEKEGE